MQLSSQARKAVATGLAASTILWSAIGIVPRFASAAVHSDGCVVLSGGVVWLITGGTRRGFTSAEVFMSSGYNFSQVVAASTEDTALPVGPIMTYADGTLVKGPSDPLVYLVTGGQKRGFVSGAVFTGNGFSFANIQQAPANTFADLPTGANIDNTTSAHGAGVLVISSGTVWWMSASGRMGFPSMEVFNSHGLMLSHAVAANAADLASADQGAVTARPGCTGGGPVPVSGALSVSLASSTPAATSIISDADGAQALIPMLAVNFSAGSQSSTVTSVAVKRGGISANSDVSNVYLYDGNTRLAEFTSYADGVATFTNSSGLFTVPANSTRVIMVKFDLPTGTAAGKTVNFSLTAVVLSGGASVSGLPVTGNMMTTAVVSDLGKLDITAFAANFPGTADPGQTGLEVMRFTMTSSDQDIELSKVTLTMVGTIATGDVQNVKLMVAGVQIGSTQQIGSNNEVSFDLTGTPYKIMSGQGKTVTVNADIVGGTNRAFKFTIRKISDVAVRDLNYGVWIKPMVSGAAFSIVDPDAAGDGTNINAGKLTVSKSSDSPSATTAKGATGVVLAKFDLKAAGEAVKVEQITVETLFTGGTATNNLDNGKLYLGGSQIGSTADLDTAAATDSNFTDAGDDEDTAYALGNTLIIPAGTTVVLSVVADTKTGAGGTLDNTDVLVKIQPQTVTGQTSLTSISTASANGNTLTFASGALTTSKNTAMADADSTIPTGVAGTPNVRIGSFILQAGAGEGVNVTQVVLIDDMDGAGGETMADAFQNLLIKVDGAQTGSTFATLTDTASSTYTYSVSPALAIAAGAQATLDVYADILSSIAAAVVTEVNNDADGMVILSSVAATGMLTSATADDLTDRQGQLLEVATSGTFTVTSDSGTPASALIAGTGVEMEVARFTLKETTGAEGIKITQVVVKDNTASGVTSVTAGFSNAKLFIDGVQVGGTVNFSAAANGNATFSGLSYIVPANGTKTLVVKATPNAYPNGTANSDHNFQLVASAVTAQGASSSTATNAPAALVTSNTHTWARTSLGAVNATQGATSSRVRTANDKLQTVTLTSGTPSAAILRGSLQINDEAATNWSTVDGGNANAETASATTAIDGTNSIRVDATTDFDADDLLVYDTGASSVGLQNFSKVGFWVRSSKALTSGDDLSFIFNDAADVTSIHQSVSIPAMSVNQWYFVEGTLSTVTSASRFVGLRVLSTGELATGDFVYIDNVRFYNDSVLVTLTGNLKATLGSAGKAVSLKDSSGNIKLLGYAHTTVQDTETATLIVGDDAGATAQAGSTAGDINVSSSGTALDLILSSVDHVLTDAGAAAEAFTTTINLGSSTTDGDVRWYDAAVVATTPLTWVNGSTPLQTSVSYQ